MKIIKDPFLGEIEVEIIDQSSKHGMGESVYENIYKDKHGNFYIETFNLMAPEDKNMVVINKRQAEIISKNV